MRNRRIFIGLLWLAFVSLGAFHSIVAPMWDGFDEPGHLAYILFIDDHGRVPGFTEPSFPGFFLTVNRHLPSTVGVGAPSFAQWHAMSQQDRNRHRAIAGASSGDAGYASSNYQRQQGPVFYFLAAIPAWFLRGVSLPMLVVAMRLFCVLLASLCVPISAAALFELAGADGLAIGLPIVALAPNTLFAVDRISNEALVLPIMAAIAYGLIVLVKTASPRHCLLVGALAAIGMWTRFTIACVLPAIVIALLMGRVRAMRSWCAALLPPLIALAALAAWNKVQSGDVTGLVERTSVSRTSIEDLRQAFAGMHGVPLIAELTRNHIWAGGWGFVRPPDWIYALVVAAVASLFVAALLRCRKPLSPALPALVAVAVAYGFAMWGHMFNGVLARLHNPNFPLIGAEGWYLDEMRAMEAAVIAAIAAAAVIDARLVARLTVLALALANLLGIALLLLPHWAGRTGYTINRRVYMAAMEAMPVRVSAILPLLLMMIWLAAIALAIARLSQRPADALPAPADSRAPYKSTARSDRHR